MKKIITCLLLLLLCTLALASCSVSLGKVTTTTKPEPVDPLQMAKDYLFGMYKDDATITGADYDVVGVVSVNGTKYNVTWTVDVAEGVVIAESDKEYMVKVDVDEKTANDVNYTLTATISDDEGNTVSVSFDRTVPKFAVLTFDEYVAAAKDDNVVVRGIISGFIRKANGASANSFYMHDADGGYYIYALTSDPVTDLGLAVGMEVMVTGIKDIYNGTHEVKNAVVEIVNETPVAVTPVDFTEIFTNAGALTDAALAYKQALLVTIHGAELQAQSADDISGGYYRFKIGELSSYLRISGSACPLSKDEQDAFKAAHTANVGRTATVTGVICVYNNAFYLTPVDGNALTNFADIERSDAEKIAYEKELLTLIGNIVADGTVVTLPATGSLYNNVVITWAISENTCTTLVDGKLTFTLPEEATTLTLTATLTLGENLTETKEFTIKVDAATTDLYVPEKVETPAAETAYKFFLSQNKRGEVLYFAGAMSGNYLATTDKVEKATDVYLETVEGGFKFYFMDGETKTYIDAYEYTTGKVGVRLTTEPTAVWAFDADLGVLTATVIEKVWYLGTYNTYNTMSLSETWRISGEKAGDVGVSQFPAYLATLELKKVAPAKVETPAAETAYKFFLSQNKRGEVLYFAGAMSGNYLATTDKVEKATDVYLETVEGGFKFYFMDGETKTYIDAYEYTTGKVGVRLTTEPTAVWAFDADLGVLTATVIEKVWYLGTYNTYNTMSLSETWRISGEKAGDVGVSQFPAYLATIEFVKDTVEPPVVEKTDAEKVAEDKAALNVNANATADFTLPVAGANGSVISWASDNAAIAIEGANATVTRGDADVTVTLTATITLGEVTETATFTVTVAKEGTEEPPVEETVYTVAGILDVMANYTDGQVSTEEYIVSGVVTSSSYNSKYGSYTIWLLNGDKAQAFELYSVGMDASITGDYTAANALVGYTVTCKGLLKRFGTTYEMAYISNPTHTPTITSVVAPTDASKVAVDNTALDLAPSISTNVTLATTGAAGSTITWASSNTDVIATDGTVTRPAVGAADATVTLTATITCGETSMTRTFTVTVPAETGVVSNDATYDLTNNFSSYSSNWGTSYDARTIQSTVLGADIPAATIVFSRASKQSSTITNAPVLATNTGKSAGTVYVTFSLTETGKTLSSVTFNLQRWTDSKKFTNISIEYKDASGNWVNSATLISVKDAIALSDPTVDFASAALPSGVTEVRLVVTGTSSSNMQLGVTGIKVVTQ